MVEGAEAERGPDGGAGAPAALAAFRRALAPAGLNLVGVVAAEAARAAWLGGSARGAQAGAGAGARGDDPLLGAGSVVVVGSGGRAFWAALAPDLRGLAHPVEAGARRAVARALGALPDGARLLAQADADRFDLRRLGALAGFGAPSRLELLVHPVFGPWVSLRALVAVAPAWAPTPPSAWDPCGPCARPCLDACPVGAYAPDRAFDARRCATHRLAEPPPARSCADACHARAACVVGREHAYDGEETRHRHRAGLPMLRAWLGAGDPA